MQRRVYVPGAVLAATLLAGLTGCTGATGTGANADDSKPGEPPATTAGAEPGRYRTLPEPCGAVGRGTLDTLLPGLEALDGAEQEKAYDGEAAITYDTDRRVGCGWKAEAETATHHVKVDFERVVSYDPAVSDDDRAQELYNKKASQAGIPAVPSAGESGDGEPSASASESAAEKGADNATRRSKSGAAGKKKSNAEETGPSSAGTESAGQDIAPRALNGLGDVAYLNDDANATGLHRGITVAFRSSNVIVTVKYDQWSTPHEEPPTSQDLQEKAQRLARELAGKLSE